MARSIMWDSHLLFGQNVDPSKDDRISYLYGCRTSTIDFKWKIPFDENREPSCLDCAKVWGKMRLDSLKASHDITVESLSKEERGNFRSLSRILHNGDFVGYIGCLNGWGASWRIYGMRLSEQGIIGVEAETYPEMSDNGKAIVTGIARDALLVKIPDLVKSGTLMPEAVFRATEAEKRLSADSRRQAFVKRMAEEEMERADMLAGLKSILDRITPYLSNTERDAIFQAYNRLSNSS